MPVSNPVIVVPGITASYLQDDYPVSPETIWGVVHKDYERAALHPDNLRYEAREPARVVSGQVYEIAYKELIEELRFNLAEKPEEPVPVFPFGYDWRQPLELVEDALLRFVDEVIERTKLMPHYHKAGYGADPKVNLVGHSMGGLVIAGMLARHGQTARAGKVATLASPFQGSFESVIKVTTGTANLGTSPPSSREREAARMTPALYYLVPSFANGLDVPPSLPQTLFDPAVWQPSILTSLEQYIRLHGLEGGNQRARTAQARSLFATMLTAASDHRQRLDGLNLPDAGLETNDWLCVVGVDSVTRVRLHVKRKGQAAEFDFRSDDRANLWGDEKAPTSEWGFTGDGTVPFEGAVPKFLDRANLVCVTPDDYGYWELSDRATTKLAGFHGILPNMNMLHRLIVRHFTGRPDRHGNTWGRPAPGVEAWAPPLDLHNKQKD
ncbi:MAG: hypothetical protein CMM50_15100 [Rhodospirillaceae bacterium]|nr:hypothetical protein [Rhodospirillaceae bacterium]|tara:strand:- start:63 stop:1379 length:1317 start_codon:yes stop_codon:yes gene_type:complete